METNLMV